MAGSGQDLNYYISNSGNDANDGHSPAQAWETIRQLVTVTFQPDDSVFFNRGDEWVISIHADTALKVKGDGANGHPVVITAYGTGTKPILTAKDTVVGWSGAANWSRPWEVTRPNVWYQEEARTPLYYSANRMWLSDTEAKKASIFGNLSATNPWYWSGDDSLFIYSTSNPATAFTNIEKGTASYHIIELYGDNYFEISYLDLRHGYMTIEIRGSDGIVIDSCDLTGYFGVNGWAAIGEDSRDVIIRNCNFDSGVKFTDDYEAKYTEDGLKIGSSTKNWLIYNNTFRNWNHSSFVLESLVTDGRRIDSVKIYNNDLSAPDIDYGGRIGADYYDGEGNEIYNNYIHNISIQSQLNGYRLKFYYNIIDTVTSPVWRSGYGSGISIQGYSMSTRPQYMEIYNNIIANTADNGIYSSWYPSRAVQKYNKIINNIIYEPTDYGIYILDADSIYANHYRNNLIYKTGDTDVIYYRGTLMTIDEFNDINGTESDIIMNNLGDDPLFSGTTFELTSTSKAINGGVDVGLTSDYAGTSVPQGFYFDIGAYEFESFPIATTGLGWENIYSKRNFKDDVNIAAGFSVDGVPIVFSGGAPVNIPGLTASASELNILDGATVTTTEINYSSGATGNLQGQINAIEASTVDDSKADTSLSNLSSVAINTHLLPGTDGAVNLGSATKQFGNIYLNGSISTATTITATGLVSTGALQVGGTGLTIDSIGLVDNRMAFYDGLDTLGIHIITADIQDLSDVAVMEIDSIGGAGDDLYITETYFNTHSTSWDSTYIYTRHDSLLTAFTELQTEITSVLPPTFESAEVGDNASRLLRVVMSENLVADSIPATSTFYFTYGSEVDTIDIINVSISSDTIFFVLDQTPQADTTLKLAYTKPAIGPLQDSDENEVKSFTNKAVTNNGYRPTISKIEIGDFADDTVLVVWNKYLDQDSVPPQTAFTFKEGGTTYGLNGISIGHDSLFIALDSVAHAVLTYTLDYVRDYPYLQDSAGYHAVGFTGTSVTNNISDPYGPEMLSNGALTSGTDWTVTGSGFSIVSNELVYTGSGYGNIEQVQGDMAVAIEVETDYRLTFNLTSSAPGITIRLRSSNAAVSYNSSNSYTGTGGVVQILFTTPSDIGIGGLRISAVDGAAAATIDNLSLTEVY